MFCKLLPLYVAMGVSITAQQASAYYLEATATMNAKGETPDAVLCGGAPNQEFIARQDFTKKSACLAHDSCTSVKNSARIGLNALQAAPYDVCRKYTQTNKTCDYHCD